jgi:ribonuclease P protein component
MRSSEEFRETVRRGARAGRPTLIVHAGLAAAGDRLTAGQDWRGVRVGFVVSKAVGNAVTRNRVKRRLRHLVAGVLPSTPSRVRVVVRALPRAATHPHEVPADLAKAWSRALQRLAVAPPAKATT